MASKNQGGSPFAKVNRTKNPMQYDLRAAGVLPVCSVNDEAHVLLGLEMRKSAPYTGMRLNPLGGIMLNQNKENPALTASREFTQRILGVVDWDQAADLVWTKSRWTYLRSSKYVLYCFPMLQDDIERRFQEKLATCPSSVVQRLVWCPWSLLRAYDPKTDEPIAIKDESFLLSGFLRTLIEHPPVGRNVVSSSLSLFRPALPPRLPKQVLGVSVSDRNTGRHVFSEVFSNHKTALKAISEYLDAIECPTDRAETVVNRVFYEGRANIPGTARCITMRILRIDPQGFGDGLFMSRVDGSGFK